MVNCTICTKEIPEKRLKALPSARQCVSCIEQMGDRPNISQPQEIRPVYNTTVIDYSINTDQEYEWLTVPRKRIAGYHMSEAFEEDDSD